MSEVNPFDAWCQIATTTPISASRRSRHYYSHGAVLILFVVVATLASTITLSFLASRCLIQNLLVRAGIEQNPGPMLGSEVLKRIRNCRVGDIYSITFITRDGQSKSTVHVQIIALPSAANNGAADVMSWSQEASSLPHPNFVYYEVKLLLNYYDNPGNTTQWQLPIPSDAPPEAKRQRSPEAQTSQSSAPVAEPRRAPRTDRIVELAPNVLPPPPLPPVQPKPKPSKNKTPQPSQAAPAPVPVRDAVNLAAIDPPSPPVSVAALRPLLSYTESAVTPDQQAAISKPPRATYPADQTHFRITLPQVSYLPQKHPQLGRSHQPGH